MPYAGPDLHIGERARECRCVANHNPEPESLDQHHVWPLGWAGPDVAANLITVCPSTHRNVHELLRAYRRFGGPGQVPAIILQHYGRYAIRLAALGWLRWDRAGRPGA